MKLLENNLNEKIKNYNITELEELAKEIREFLVDSISKTGGHLASNLGIIELTIALHSVFDTKKDKIVWDVGHQSYPHKILTSRGKSFSTLRQYKGLSGFPKCNESIHDHFDVGHSSTSISAALGMAKARDLNNQKNYVISVIGDGSISNGLAFEGMNNIEDTKMIVILNDNEMSISKNVGSISKILTRLSVNTKFVNSKNTMKRVLFKVPVIGRGVKRIKDAIKELVEYNSFFTELGFKYVGPVDGHNIKELKKVLNIVKDYNGPVLLHVLTKKGKGYKFAEDYPNIYHGVSKFNPNELIINNKKDYSYVLGNKLVRLAHKNKKIVCISAAMTEGTGLALFKEKYVQRYFDVGIAESHAVTFAAGLAKSGYKPFVVIYSTFLQRAYDQIVHDVCMQNLNVTLCIDRAGLVGNDGATHHGIFDLSFLIPIPNITIIAPSSYNMLENALDFANKYEYPLAIRYPRGIEGNYNSTEKLTLGKSRLIQKGKDLTIIGVGKMTNTAFEVAEILKNKYSIEIIDAIFVKPIDSNLIAKSVKKTKKIFIIEDNLKSGGYGESVISMLIDKHLDFKAKIFGYDNKYIEHGNTNELELEQKMDSRNIAKEIEKML